MKNTSFFICKFLGLSYFVSNLNSNYPTYYDIINFLASIILNPELPTVACKDDEFSCPGERRCLHERVKCDGVRDCSNGEDEEDCKGFISMEFINENSYPQEVIFLLINCAGTESAIIKNYSLHPQVQGF